MTALRRSVLLAAIVALFAGLALAIPRESVTLRTLDGLGFDELAKDPSMELVFPNQWGVYKLPRELRLERNLEYSHKNLQVPYDDPRLASPYQLVKANRQVRAMLRAQFVGSSRARGQAPGAVGARPATWRSLGPDNLGGRTHALVIDPNDRNVVYAGGIGGGVWKSTDRGESWRPLNDTLSNVAVSALVFDPNNSQTLFAGTGDTVDQHQRIASRGAGIMKTTDGGQSWEFLASTQNRDFAFVNTIKFSPNDPNKMYVGTSTGLWVSTDAGQNWSQSYASQTEGRDLGCTDITIRTDRNPDEIVISCGGMNEGEGVFRSVDGGGSWENVIPDVLGQIPGRAAVAYAPSNQDVVYASIADLNGRALALMRSDQSGAAGTWQVVNTAGTGGGSPPWFGWCDDLQFSSQFGQGYYDNVLAVDPTNHDRLWIGGVDTFRSDDGGKTLTVMSYWWLAYVNNFPKTMDGLPYSHADQHVMFVDPGYDGNQNTTLWLGNDGGIFRTDNATAELPSQDCAKAQNKVVFDELNTGYSTSLFREGAISDDGLVLAGGLQDNGTWLESNVTKAPNEWDTIAGGDGGYVGLNANGAEAYVTYPGGFVEIIDVATLTASNGMAGITEEGNFVTPIARDPNNPDILWWGGSTMFRTTNAARGWEPASYMFTGTAASTMGVAYGDSNVVYAGLFDGTVWRTTTGLATPPTWEQVGAGTFPFAEVTSIGFDPNDKNTVYVTFAQAQLGRVFKTTDGGATWTMIDGTAPQGIPEGTGTHSVAVNPTNSAMVYVGTDSGVFESLDGGATWRVANENLATTTVEDLIFAPGTSELHAYTYGRGVYRVDVGNQAPPVNDSLEAATEVNLNPDFKDKVSVRLANSDAGDPPVGCGPGGGAQTKSVWYRFSPPDGGSFEISTDDSNYDTVVAVYTGSSGALTQVACDDDALGPGGASQVTYDAQPGATYYIEVTKSSDAVAEGLGGALVIRVTRK